MNAKQLTLAMVVAYLSSSIAAALACLLYDPETVAAAPMVSLFNVPSNLLFLALQTQRFQRHSGKAHVLYVFSAVVVSVVFIYPAMFSREAGGIAMYCLELYAIGAVAAYVALLGTIRLRKTAGPVANSSQRG